MEIESEFAYKKTVDKEVRLYHQLAVYSSHFPQIILLFLEMWERKKWECLII